MDALCNNVRNSNSKSFKVVDFGINQTCVCNLQLVTDYLQFSSYFAVPFLSYCGLSAKKTAKSAGLINIHCVSKNIPDIFDCSLKINYKILIIFGRIFLTQLAIK